MLSEIHTSRQERRQGREVSWTTRGEAGGREQGEGGHRGRGLGLPPKEAMALMPSLVNRVPGAVPLLLGRSGLLCH